jgi:hypothetical protein
LIITVLCPKVGIRRDHPVKRQNLAAAGFIHQIEPGPYVLGFTFFKDTIPEFRMIGSIHFMDIEQDVSVTDYKVSKVMHIMNGHIITNIRIYQTIAIPQVLSYHGAVIQF